MKFLEAIAAIGGLEIENKDEILKALNSRSKELSGLEAQNQTLQKTVDSLLEVAGAEGEDLNKKLESAQGKIKSLNDASTKATADLQAKEQELNQFKRRSLIQDAANKSGANFEVLNSLLANVTEDLSVGDDGVALGGKALKDYALSNWSAFVPALFPNSNGSGQTPSPLPTGSPQGKPQEADAVDAYLKSYSIPNYLKQDG